jgi:hypothetical protein
LNTIADGFFGGALLGAILTSYFVLSRPTVERPNAAASAIPRLAPMPVTGPNWPTWGLRPAGVGGGLWAAWTY